MAIVGHFTYSGDPRTSNRDAVRYLIRDTDEADPQVSDEEIAYELSVAGDNAVRAAANCASSLAARYAQQVQTKTVGPLSISYAARAEDMRTMAADLRSRADRGYGAGFAPYAGGISKSDKETNAADTDWDKGAFALGMHANPGGSATSILSATT